MRRHNISEWTVSECTLTPSPTSEDFQLPRTRCKPRNLVNGRPGCWKQPKAQDNWPDLAADSEITQNQHLISPRRWDAITAQSQCPSRGLLKKWSHTFQLAHKKRVDYSRFCAGAEEADPCPHPAKRPPGRPYFLMVLPCTESHRLNLAREIPMGLLAGGCLRDWVWYSLLVERNMGETGRSTWTATRQAPMHRKI